MKTKNVCLHPETVQYIAEWVRQLYIPASSVGDNLHIADCIEGMVQAPSTAEGEEKGRGETR